MDYAISRGAASSCEMLECARILRDIDEERRTLASFASVTQTHNLLLDSTSYSQCGLDSPVYLLEPPSPPL